MTAYRYVRLGLLPAHKEGATWQVDRRDLEAFRRRDAAPRSEAGRSAPWAERLEARLLAGDSAGAWQVVEAAQASGMAVADVYLQMIGPAMRSIGSRWERGEIGVATEHRASGIAHRILGRIGHRLVRRGRSRGTVVVGTPPGELHLLPVTMVADLIRSGGFEAMDLGANLPIDAFVAATREADRLVGIGVSVTTPGRDEAAAATIAALRGAHQDTPIFVGGWAIRDADHASSLGADFYAEGALAAMEWLQAS